MHRACPNASSCVPKEAGDQHGMANDMRSLVGDRSRPSWHTERFSEQRTIRGQTASPLDFQMNGGGVCRSEVAEATCCARGTDFNAEYSKFLALKETTTLSRARNVAARRPCQPTRALNQPVARDTRYPPWDRSQARQMYRCYFPDLQTGARS